MERFEYEITTHSSDAFRRVIYFCSPEGSCGIEEVPAEEPQVLADLLNERGLEGWELVQFMVGRDGIMACWKRKLVSAKEYHF